MDAWWFWLSVGLAAWPTWQMIRDTFADRDEVEVGE